MSTYKALKTNNFYLSKYKIVPIRLSDRYTIMNWRNDQIEHLRQREYLTKEKQDQYFEKVIKKEFKEKYPNQILFSFLKNDKFIGYGGLVHIDYFNKNAEISFLTNSSLDHSKFERYWSKFINLIKIVAFKELSLLKIYAFAFDIRPKLYDIFNKIGFLYESRIRNNYQHKNKIYDTKIYSIWNNNFKFKRVGINDLKITYNWAKDPEIRKFSQNNNAIPFKEHKKWFEKMINKSQKYIFLLIYQIP